MKRSATSKEKRYQAMIENSYDVVALVDANGMYSYVSSVVKRVLGYDYTELIGKNSLEFVHSDDLPYVRKTLFDIAKKRKARAHAELRFLHKNKTWRWLEAQATNMLYDPSVNAIVCNFHDITERKNAQEDLASREHQMKLITDAVPVLISYVDKDLRYQFSNRSYEQWFGITQKHVSGKSMQNVLGRKAYKTLKPYVTKALAGKAASFEALVPYKKGLPRYVLGNYVPHFGKNKDVLGFYAVVQDITERKIAEEALMESENKFRNMAESAPVMIWVTKTDGYCVYINKRWSDFTGQTYAESMGYGWLNCVHKDDMERITDIFFKSVKNKVSFSMSYRLMNKDGSYRWMLDTGAPTYDSHGRFEGYIGSVTDVHERVELERRKDEFMSVASHELKTPVTSLKGYVQLLQRIFLNTNHTTALQMLIKMDSQIDKLTHLIVDLLDVSKIEAGKLQFKKKKIAVYPLLKETIENVQATSDYHAIILEGTTRAYISADPDRISQVLTNLLANAIKYSPRAKKIVVSVSRRKNTIIISVQDFGIGMSKKQQEHIFERFYQVNMGASRKTYAGLGIGLYISQELAQRHGGEITVSSKLGKGSTFQLLLPTWEFSKHLK